MSFSRLKTKLIYDYHLFGNHIEEISIVKDIRVVFKTNLSFQSHVDHICMKSLRTLGFLIRNTKEQTVSKNVVHFFSKTHVGILFNYLEPLTSRTDGIP